MAVYQPDMDHLRAQLASIADQDAAPRWLVLVEADGASGDAALDLAQQLGLDAVVVRGSGHLDSVRAFELGLFTTLDLTDDHPDALIALSDQDDVWHTDRLARGVAALAGAPDTMLVHSDARLVDGQGAFLHASMFAFEKRHKNPRLRGLLYRNNVTGMTVLMRRAVVEVALPFPPQSGVHFFHDLWLALVAQAMGAARGGKRGGVDLINAPLVDYRQHGGNAVGAVDRSGSSFRGMGRINRNWLVREAGGYGLARYLAHSLHSRMEQADVGVDVRALSPWRRGMGLAHWWDAPRLLVTGHFGLARIAVGHGLVAAGRVAWSARMAWRDGMPKAMLRFDRRIYGLSPGVEPAGLGHSVKDDGADAADLIDMRKTPGWVPRMDAPQASINLLIPTLNPAEAFAGVGTAMDLGLGLAARGHRVRMIATDMPMVSEPASRRFILARLDAAHKDSGAADRLTLCCGVMGQTDTAAPELPSHIDDTFIATAWWSAHVAQTLIANHGYTQPRIGYLIQDFEPNFYAWGGEFADAMASYDMNILPVFNTTLLRAYFKDLGFGFADDDALAFRPSIDVTRYSSGARVPATGPRKLALYGRPEVARNMFPLALEAREAFVVAQNLGPDDIEIVSAGMAHAPVDLANGVTVKSVGKLPWEAYPGFLLGLDLGLSLMYSPHPSHPPLEMAASGVRVVTNDFGPKRLGDLSDAIVSAPARAADLSGALVRAWQMGPVAQDTRALDLSPLWLSLSDALDRLSFDMADLAPTREARP